MSSRLIRNLLVLILLTAFTSGAQPLQYPVTPKKTRTDIYPGGFKIEDPYHWLEDDHAPETIEWVTIQNQFTKTYIDSIHGRDSMNARMTRYWNFSRYDTPFKVGNGYMYYRNDGLQNQPVLFYMKGLNYVPLSYFDPNKLSANGTLAISQTIPNSAGNYLAFVISDKGSDWNEIRIKETQTMKTLPEVLQWVKFSNVSWKGNGFFYSRYSAPEQGKELTAANTLHRIYYHTLNTAQSQDSLVFEDNQQHKRTYRTYVTPDEKYLVIMGSESTSGNSVYVCDLSKPGSKPLLMEKGFENEFNPIGNKGEELFFFTDKNADRKKVIRVKISGGKFSYSDAVTEQEYILTDAEISGNYIVCNYLRDATSKLYFYAFDGQRKGEIPLPGLGTVEKMNGSPKDTILFFNFTGFTTPPVIYRFNTKSLRLNEQFRAKTPFNPNDYVTEQVFYLSKDKTRIPMFLVHKKGTIKDKNTPVLLYGYGGFNISKTPEFKSERLPFLESGGMIALPNLRGGGEYGRSWHEAGIKDKKQNVFDDFIAAAEWLIQEGYTNSSKLAIQGRSNGGLLVGAVMTQRPDLFKVALPAVGVMDMLRYHKFTIGWAWAEDYGTSDDSTGFQVLRKYSPLHSLKEGSQYPATLITTADHDDRVVPAHSFKFAARLQEVQEGNNPVLIRIDTGAGHGAGKPTSKQIDEQTDIFSFLFHNLGMKL